TKKSMTLPYRQLQFLCRYVAVVVLLLHLPVQAAPLSPINVTASPGSQPLAIGSPAPVLVTWAVTTNGDQALDPVTLDSPSGVFRAGGPGGPILATTPRGLSTTVLGVGPTIFVRTFTEGVAVPESVKLQALQMGFNTIIYERTFSTTVGAFCIQCNPTA